MNSSNVIDRSPNKLLQSDSANCPLFVPKSRPACYAVEQGIMFFKEFTVDPKIIAVVIGVVGALLGVYLKEHLDIKNKQKRAIKILRSNLFLFLNKVQENEHLGKLLMTGSALDTRYIESLKSGDDSHYKELLTQIDNIDVEELLTDKDVETLCKKIRLFSNKEMEVIYKEIDRIREDIEHGTYILGNSDLNLLDTNMVYRVLQAKRSINDIFLTIKLVITCIHEREEIDNEYVKYQTLDAVKEAVLACRHVLPLMRMCNDKS